VAPRADRRGDRRDEDTVRIHLRRPAPVAPHRTDRLRVPGVGVAAQGHRTGRARPAPAPRQGNRLDAPTGESDAAKILADRQLRRGTPGRHEEQPRGARRPVGLSGPQVGQRPLAEAVRRAPEHNRGRPVGPLLAEAYRVAVEVGEGRVGVSAAVECRARPRRRRQGRGTPGAAPPGAPNRPTG